MRVKAILVIVAAVLVLAGCKREKKEKPDAPASPVAAQGTHVWDPNVVVLDKPSVGAAEIERVPIGTRVAVEAIAGNPDYVRIVSGTKKKGFLLARVVRAEKPVPATLLATARERLGAGDLVAALENAERVLALADNATLGEALDLLEAMYEAQGSSRDVKRVREIRKTSKAPAPTPTPDAAAIPVKEAAAGDLRWVSATSLLLKDKPDVSAKTIAELPINTEVKVTAASGEWLAIEATLLTPSVFRIENEISPVSGETRVVRGHARPRFLAEAPLARDALLAEADAFEKKGDMAEAVRRLERASALDPDPILVQRVARVATQAKLYRIAARASARLTRGADGRGALETLDATTVWGCRGDLSKAVIVDVSQAASAPRDACITNVPSHDECAPCGPSGIMVSEDESSDRWQREAEARISNESIEDPDEIATIMAEAAEAKETAVQEARKEFAAEQASHEEAQKAWDAAHEEWVAETSRLRALYPDGPYAKIELPPSTAEGTLVAWSRTAHVVEDYCGNLQLGWDATGLSDEFPAKSDRERTFWLSVSDPDVAIFGIDSPDEVDDECGEESERAGGCAPSPSLFPKLQSCGCCGC